MALSILIGTAIVWGVTALVVIPLAQLLARRRQVAAASAAGHSLGESEAAQGESSIPTDCFIMADVLVLSVAGLLIGLASGYFLLGFAWSWKHWPGILCLITLSALGAALHP
ncbi:MAG: hypothetical protein Q8P22_09460 [Chloroflexota bacterium]|nr:hypothetical protein [Chloroflexota bacterium]